MFTYDEREIVGKYVYIVMIRPMALSAPTTILPTQISTPFSNRIAATFGSPPQTPADLSPRRPALPHTS